MSSRFYVVYPLYTSIYIMMHVSSNDCTLVTVPPEGSHMAWWTCVMKQVRTGLSLCLQILGLSILRALDRNLGLLSGRTDTAPGQSRQRFARCFCPALVPLVKDASGMIAGRGLTQGS